MGKKKANIALANLILRICYHMLKDGTIYEEVGDRYYNKKQIDREKKLITELKVKGYIVERAI
ncbi:hypothetical protein [Alkaliphilus metalliredigens]|nr:hypothetical protein [Alkaliphilus metalliredigens]